MRELLDRVLAAQAAGTPLRIRGSGSKDFYGDSSQGEPLDVRGWSGIESYEPSELVVKARAGTPLHGLERELAANGQCLAFEPPHFGGAATVGGMVAAGLSGPARATAGAVRDHLLGATLLNGRGERLRFGGQVMKNVAGYDVSRLLAGSMGTLGVILDVSLKVMPLPAATATLRFELDAARALAELNRWAGQPWPLSASAWLEAQGGGVLLLRLSGARAAVSAAARQLGGERLADADAAATWQALREQTHPFFQPLAAGEALWRFSLPSTAPLCPLAGRWLIEWGGAQRWLIADHPAALVRSAASAAGGHATLFRRGASTPASEPTFTPLPAVPQRIHRALKASFDPAGIFNPGRLGAAL